MHQDFEKIIQFPLRLSNGIPMSFLIQGRKQLKRSGVEMIVTCLCTHGRRKGCTGGLGLWILKFDICLAKRLLS